MRRLIVDIYCILFGITKSKPLSVGIAVIYMTVLNLVMIQGLGLLLQGWLPLFSAVRTLFVMPYFLVTAVAVAAITFWLMPPVVIMAKEYKKKDTNAWVLIAYTLFAALLFAYIQLGDKIF